MHRNIFLYPFDIYEGCVFDIRMFPLTILNLGYTLFIIMIFIPLYISRKLGVKYCVFVCGHCLSYNVFHIITYLTLFINVNCDNNVDIFVLMFLNGYLLCNDLYNFIIHCEELCMLWYCMDHQINWYLN
jgi:hypothetical protein